MKILIITLLGLSTLVSCKKKYTCECGNPGGIYKTFTIRDTKKNAKEKCHDTDQDVPFSETYCNLK
jgi:hypothetical protein